MFFDGNWDRVREVVLIFCGYCWGRGASKKMTYAPGVVYWGPVLDLEVELDEDVPTKERSKYVNFGFELGVYLGLVRLRDERLVILLLEVLLGESELARLCLSDVPHTGLLFVVAARDVYRTPSGVGFVTLLYPLYYGRCMSVKEYFVFVRILLFSCLHLGVGGLYYSGSLRSSTG